MEETPVRPSTQHGGKTITRVDTPVLQHCVSAVLVHSIRVRKLPEQVAADGVRLGITIEINGSTFTTAPTTAVPDGTTRDPITGSVGYASHGRHTLYEVRMDNVDVLFPGSRRRSERYGKPPAFIANPRELRDGVKVILHSMDQHHTIFGSTICVCSGESSFMSHPRGEATVDFRVFSCKDGVVNMEPSYNRASYVKTYLGDDPKEKIQSMMEKERAKRNEKGKQRVERVSLDALEESELKNSTESNSDVDVVPEGSPYMVEGGDGEVIVPPTTIGKAEPQPKSEFAHRVDDNDDWEEETLEQEDTWVAEASHIAVEGSFSGVSVSGCPGFPSDSQLPIPESTPPLVSLGKKKEANGVDVREEARRRAEEAAAAAAAAAVYQNNGVGGVDAIVTLPIGDSQDLGKDGKVAGDDDDEEEAEWEREEISTEQYTEALTAQVDRIRVQSAPHFPDRLTSVMRSLVPCGTKEKLAAAFDLYDVEKKGLITREQLVHFCRAHQPYADWCTDDDTLLLSLAPYIPPSLLELNALPVTGGEGALEEKPEEGNALGLSGEEEAKGDTNGVNGSRSHIPGEESALGFPRLNVNYLYYHPENRDAPLQINREFFDVIGLRLAGS